MIFTYRRFTNIVLWICTLVSFRLSGIELHPKSSNLEHPVRIYQGAYILIWLDCFYPFSTESAFISVPTCISTCTCMFNVTVFHKCSLTGLLAGMF